MFNAYGYIFKITEEKLLREKHTNPFNFTLALNLAK